MPPALSPCCVLHALASWPPSWFLCCPHPQPGLTGQSYPSAEMCRCEHFPRACPSQAELPPWGQASQSTLHQPQFLFVLVIKIQTCPEVETEVQRTCVLIARLEADKILPRLLHLSFFSVFLSLPEYFTFFKFIFLLKYG